MGSRLGQGWDVLVAAMKRVQQVNRLLGGCNAVESVSDLSVFSSFSWQKSEPCVSV